MAEGLDPDTKHGTSDYYYDPYCDSCHEEGRNVEPFSFCSDCDTFLCERCHRVHARLPYSRTHTVQLGDYMPQGHSSRDVTYSNCSKHAKVLIDNFCLIHQEMICEKCKAEFHYQCDVKSIADACELIDFSGIRKAKEVLLDLQKCVVDSKETLEQTVDSVEDKRNSTMSDLKSTYDTTISVINSLFEDMNTEVSNTFSVERNNLSDKLVQLSVLQREIGSSLANIQNIDSGKVDPQSFISLLNILAAVRRITKDFEQITKNSDSVDIVLSISEELQTFLANCTSFGKLNVRRKKLLSKSGFPELDINFPIKSLRRLDPVHTNKTAGTMKKAVSNKEKSKEIDEARCDIRKKDTDHFTISPDLTQLRAVRQTPLFVQANVDLQDCNITGIAVRGNGELLVADNKNQNVKLFSSNGHLLSSAKFSSRPWDITIINDNSAIVSLEWSGLSMLDLSNPRTMSVRLTIHLSYLVWAVARCGTEIAVTCGSPPTIVKTIRTDGVKLWSVEKFSYGEKLGEHLDYITSQEITKPATLLVTDSKKETISVLRAETGAVMRVCNVPGKKPKGIVVDKSGFVYVCHGNSAEIAVWSTDLSETSCLISACRNNPRAIAYNPTKHELIVSYKDQNIVDRYTLESDA